MSFEVVTPGNPGGQEPAAPASTSEPGSPSPKTGDGQPGSTPEPIKLSDDSLVMVPGRDKPVKYGEYFRGFQSQFTKTAQERAELDKKLRQIEAERQAEQRELQALRAGQRPDPNAGRAALADKLKALPYLKGQEAAEMVDTIMGEINSYGQALQMRDMALRLLNQRLQQLDQTVTGLNRQSTQASFNTKMSQFRQELGLPEEAQEWLEELYLAYEGDDLDREFPTIAKRRWEQLQSIARAADQKKVTEARGNRFTPPKGGVGTPGKPLDLSRLSAKESADLLWNQLNGATNT